MNKRIAQNNLKYCNVNINTIITIERDRKRNLKKLKICKSNSLDAEE